MPMADAHALAGFKPHRANGNRLLRRPDVAARISELQREHGERTGITGDRILVELSRVAFGKVTRALEVDPATSGWGWVISRCCRMISPPRSARSSSATTAA
jgi:hypothetical protein